MRDDGKPIFVVQKHRARTLHYDFRIEVGGVLKSWAVPKGPSTDPRVKRLAVAVEDHALDYAGFEGVIPEGQPGAGPVIVWDRGTYRNLREGKEKDGSRTMEESLEEGLIEVWLEGEKLRGGYALIRTKARYTKKESWLLSKMKDAMADPERDITRERPESVVSGKRIEEIEENKQCNPPHP